MTAQGKQSAASEPAAESPALSDEERAASLPFSILSPDDPSINPSEAERAERVKRAQAMIADAEARKERDRVATPAAPDRPVRDDGLHTEGKWGNYRNLKCRLCDYAQLVYPGRDEEDAKEAIFVHFLGVHLGETDEDQDEE